MVMLVRVDGDVDMCWWWCWCVDLYVVAGPQYGSVERAWLAVMTEADKVSELHQEVKNGLLNEDVEKVKNWQKDSYHKQMIGGFKEAKEAEEGFKKAQKPWAKKLKEVRIRILSLLMLILKLPFNLNLNILNIFTSPCQSHTEK